jgi:hypothetical protein
MVRSSLRYETSIYIVHNTRVLVNPLITLPPVMIINAHDLCFEAGDTGWKQGDELIADSRPLNWKCAQELIRFTWQRLRQIKHVMLLDCFENAKS